MPKAAQQLTTEQVREHGRDCIAVRVRMLSRTITRLYDDALRPYGLTVSQMNMLAAIAQRQPAAAGKVADTLSMEISTLSRNARLMEREGWVEITPAERGNGRMLAVTPAGLRKLAEVKPAWEQAQREARTLLGDDGTDQLMALADGLWAERASAAGAPALRA